MFTKSIAKVGRTLCFRVVLELLEIVVKKYCCLVLGLPKLKYMAANVYLKTGRGIFFFSLLYSCQIHRCPRCKVISSVRAGKSCHQQPDTQKCANGTSVSSPKQINHD